MYVHQTDISFFFCLEVLLTTTLFSFFPSLTPVITLLTFSVSVHEKGEKNTILSMNYIKTPRKIHSAKLILLKEVSIVTSAAL